jgi:hypothetical protein
MHAAQDENEQHVQKTKSITKGLHERIKAMCLEGLDDGDEVEVRAEATGSLQQAPAPRLHRAHQDEPDLPNNVTDAPQLQDDDLALPEEMVRHLTRPSTCHCHFEFELHDQLFLHVLLGHPLCSIMCNACELSGVAHKHIKN